MSPEQDFWLTRTFANVCRGCILRGIQLSPTCHWEDTDSNSRLMLEHMAHQQYYLLYIESDLFSTPCRHEGLHPARRPNSDRTNPPLHPPQISVPPPPGSYLSEIAAVQKLCITSLPAPGIGRRPRYGKPRMITIQARRNHFLRARANPAPSLLPLHFSLSSSTSFLTNPTLRSVSPSLHHARYFRILVCS